MSHRARARAAQVAALTILLLALAAVAFPYLWTLLTSFKPPNILSRPEVILFAPTLIHWQDVLGSDFPRYLANSIIVSLVTVAIALSTGTPAAYAFSRFNVGSQRARFSVLIAQMVPPDRDHRAHVPHHVPPAPAGHPGCRHCRPPDLHPPLGHLVSHRLLR
ncbi:MAG: hypothetical protein Q9O62_15130 [Ardenticatenia bacterium]|nr:hypothetical protein [Ardenticatenia bacterium]